MRLFVIVLPLMLASHSLYGQTTVPGYIPQRMSQVEVGGSDLKTMVRELHLDGETAAAAHRLLTDYETAVSTRGSEVRGAVAAIAPPKAQHPASIEEMRSQMMDEIREQLESRRLSGEFNDDPSRLRQLCRSVWMKWTGSSRNSRPILRHLLVSVRPSSPRRRHWMRGLPGVKR